MGLLNAILGKKNFQTLFARLHRLSLKGMNYGRASDYMNNGEEIVLKRIRRLIKTESPVLFDVGANKGEFTRRVIATWGAHDFTLYAFEPSAKTFDMLKAALPPSPAVHLFNFGLGERKESVELFYDTAGSGLASVYPRDLSFRSIDFSAHEAISLTTLDSFCEENGIRMIDFLKLDVEGHELAILKGGKKMFDTGSVGIVQFEFGGCNIDSRTFFKDYFHFFAKDFILYRILTDGLQEIGQYSENLEVFQSANYLAIKK
ncbi:MAG TPA: FkbM family methyltransferase [Cyclobacteriaceae bacterium]|nr:FkbM family methyltransferase [Cyclobacteriaceae bacterium]